MTDFLNKLLQIFSLQKSPTYKVKLLETHPKEDEILLGYIYIVHYDSHYKWAYLRCPCLKHDVIRLNLNRKQRPSWSIHCTKNNIPDVYPSIWQLDGCYSHFWIKKGQVSWARGSGRPPAKNTHKKF